MRKLYRSTRDRKLFGVCGGLADYLGVDATLLRILLIVVAVFSAGSVIVVYIIAYFVIPERAALRRVRNQSIRPRLERPRTIAIRLWQSESELDSQFQLLYRSGTWSARRRRVFQPNFATSGAFTASAQSSPNLRKGSTR